MKRYCFQCGNELRITDLDGKKRFTCSGCGWIRYENPLPAVAAFVENGKDELLLIKRDAEPYKGRWALPSGFIEIEETPEDAVLRELKEETGVDGTIERLIGVYSQRCKLYKNALLITYKIKPKGEYLCPGDDAKDVKFFSKKRLPKIPFSSHIKSIKDAQEMGKRKC